MQAKDFQKSEKWQKHLAAWIVTQSSSAMLEHPSSSSSDYRPRIFYRLFYEAWLLKNCPAFSWKILVVTLFCVLLVQFGQHTISNSEKGIFLSSGLLLSLRKQIPHGVSSMPIIFSKVNWWFQEQTCLFIILKEPIILNHLECHIL